MTSLTCAPFNKAISVMTKLKQPSVWATASWVCMLSGTAYAQDVKPQEAHLHTCTAHEDDAVRLRCYDQAAGRPAKAPVLAALPVLDIPAEPQFRIVSRCDSTSATTPILGAKSRLSERWELDATDKHCTWRFRAHHPVYMLLGDASNDMNDSPHSPTRSLPESSGTKPNLPLQNTEIKYQLSFKVKAWENLITNNGDIWFGYTQQSQWQFYNSDNSSPFRETNYQPEVITTWRTDIDLGAVKLKMLNLGLVHQSNGQSSWRSRSWNRIYAQFGFELDNFAIMVRPWYRLQEPIETDDNPDISDYVGRGDVTAIWHLGGHEISGILRHSLRRGERNRGAVQLDWAFPLLGKNLRGHVQLFSGYGQSLIDYNFRQNSVGVGISLAEWL